LPLLEDELLEELDIGAIILKFGKINA